VTGYEGLAIVALVESAVALGELERASAALDELETIPAGLRTHSLEAHIERLRALVEVAAGEHDRVESRLVRGAALFREVGMPFWLAVSLLEHAEWLASRSRADDAEPLSREAREIFGRLRAEPWIARADALGASVAVSA
jgi:hypothetical protein